MTFYFYPYHQKTNPYVENFCAIFSALGDVKAFPLSVFSALRISVRMSKKYIVLNWFEDAPSQVDLSFIRFIQCLCIVFILWLFRVKIIWFKHNLAPHAKRSYIYFKFLGYILSKVSYKAITHRPYSGFIYIPHPLCSPVSQSIIEPRIDDDFFLVFGAVKDYKRITELLLSWPLDRRLLILGFCDSATLEAAINQVIIERNLLVSWENKKFSDEVLDKYLKQCKGVVIPNNDTSMLVSGSFYMAASYRKPIIMPKSDFSSYCMTVFSSIFTFDFSVDSISLVVSQALRLDLSNMENFVLSSSLESNEIIKNVKTILDV